MAKVMLRGPGTVCPSSFREELKLVRKPAGAGEEGLRTEDFDYFLPPELIAQKPVEPRDASRLLVLDAGGFRHLYFRDLPGLLRPGDELVLNDSRVLPARLRAHKPTGGRVEVLFLRPEQEGWLALVRGLGPASEILFGDGSWRAAVVGRKEEAYLLRLEGPGSPEELMSGQGEIPLPPYIHEPLRDPERYQTVYAENPGSVAAPTAGLHFTPELLNLLAAKGIGVRKLSLHVGAGTFLPVRTEDPREHRMHSERYYLPAETADALNQAREEGRRVIAVGTTAVRVLETAADKYGRLHPGEGETDIFIYPGYRFKVVQNLLTNFHLPRSTLLMLVAALAGRERILAAYGEAVARGYRFFSFGDACLILGED